MVLSYQEFMAQGDVESFHSGQRNAQNRPLARAFKNQKTDTSPERMERLKKMLSESKTGRQTLEFLDQKGSTMVFEKMKYYGYFSPDKNLVALNPKMSDEDLAVTMVHEIRHAWQDSQMQTTSPEMTPKSFFVSGFAIEADACAAEVTYAHEMRKTNPKIWDAHQKSGYAPMSTAFEKTFKETGDVDKARADALLTWYDLKVRQSYTKGYTQYINTVARELTKQKDLEPQYFAEDRSTQKIVDTLFRDYDGKQFLSDAKSLETPERLSIGEKRAKIMSRALVPYMSKYKRTPEQLGLDKITVNREDGTTTNCAMVVRQVKDEQKLTNALKAMQQKGASR